MKIAALMLALSLGQSSPYVPSRADVKDPESHCLFWTVPKITWYQSSVGNPATKPSGSEFTAVRRSFESWQAVFSRCGNLSFEDGGIVDERAVGYDPDGANRNVVLFRTRRCTAVVPSGDSCKDDESCENIYDCWDDIPDKDGRTKAGTIAITLTTYDARSGIIYDSDIELNSAYFFFTTSDGPLECSPPAVTTNCVSTDVQNTMTHEIGHMVGMDHTNAPGSTMNPQAHPGELNKRTIDSGSQQFVCTTYPQGQVSQSCVHPNVETELGKKAQLGCSTAGAEAWLPALAGWALLLARRRRGGRS